MKVGVFDTIGGNVERYSWYAGQFEDIELIPFRGVHPRDCMAELKALGCEAVIYTYFELEPPEFFRNLAAAGIKYATCVGVGHDHFNLELMAELGIRAANVPKYSPNSVAEYAVMALLACARGLRTQIHNVDRLHYKVDFPAGREIRDMTVGVVGAGRIGSVTIECLSGFHPRQILAYTRHYSERWKPVAEYAPLEEIYEKCDAIIYHTDMNPSTAHMINRESIAKMKDGVILVNPARGGIADSEALLEGIESGKIGALALDVIENEAELRKPVTDGRCPLEILDRLLEHDNVIFTPHTAYYTDISNRELEQTTIDNLVSYARTGHSPNELTTLG